MSLVTKPELINLQKVLKTDEAIGKKLGVTQHAIFYLRKKHGIASRYVEIPERNKKIIALRKSGTPVIEIAEKLGLTVGLIRNVIKDNQEKKKPQNKIETDMVYFCHISKDKYRITIADLDNGFKATFGKISKKPFTAEAHPVVVGNGGRDIFPSVSEAFEAAKMFVEWSYPETNRKAWTSSPYLDIKCLENVKHAFEEHLENSGWVAKKEFKWRKDRRVIELYVAPRF